MKKVVSLLLVVIIGLTALVACDISQIFALVYASEGLEFALNDDGLSYSVTGIGTCTDTEIVIPYIYNKLPVTRIAEEAFKQQDKIISVVIPNSVTSIGDSAWAYSDSLERVTIGNSVKSIGFRAFRECTSLQSIIIPHSVTNISKQAFYGCDSLTSVEIGKSVTSIGDHAFAYCDSLISINVDENNSYYKSIDGNLYSKDGKTLVQYAIRKQDKSFTIPNNVTCIVAGAFAESTTLTSITIPYTVRDIGRGAFSWCTSLTNITFKGTVGEWYSIKKGEYWAYNTPTIKITCSDGTTYE